MLEVDKQSLKEAMEMADDAMARVMDSKDELLVAFTNQLHGIVVLGEHILKE